MPHARRQERAWSRIQSAHYERNRVRRVAGRVRGAVFGRTVVTVLGKLPVLVGGPRRKSGRRGRRISHKVDVIGFVRRSVRRGQYPCLSSAVLSEHPVAMVSTCRGIFLDGSQGCTRQQHHCESEQAPGNPGSSRVEAAHHLNWAGAFNVNLGLGRQNTSEWVYFIVKVRASSRGRLGTPSTWARSRFSPSFQTSQRS